VSLGYLSEIERGQKEASSELLASVCGALDVEMSELFREVTDRLRRDEKLAIANRASTVAPRLAPQRPTGPANSEVRAAATVAA
jgi:transcriptional regulator with XRE-family HTH domain